MLPKVFVIGFNKCGTTSLHRMFRRAGHVSSHYRHERPDGSFVKIARQLDDNDRAGLPLLTGMEEATAYSDMDMCQKDERLSGIARFADLDRQYPGSRFILNTRDPLRWLNSRCRHFDGGYLRRAMAQAGIGDADAMRAIWLQDWHEHHAAVRAHFAGRPGQFLEFHIEDDSPRKLSAFLADYGVKPGHWRHHNRTPEVVAMPELALAS